MKGIFTFFLLVFIAIETNAQVVANDSKVMITASNNTVILDLKEISVVFIELDD